MLAMTAVCCSVALASCGRTAKTKDLVANQEIEAAEKSRLARVAADKRKEDDKKEAERLKREHEQATNLDQRGGTSKNNANPIPPIAPVKPPATVTAPTGPTGPSGTTAPTGPSQAAGTAPGAPAAAAARPAQPATPETTRAPDAPAAATAPTGTAAPAATVAAVTATPGWVPYSSPRLPGP